MRSRKKKTIKDVVKKNSTAPTTKINKRVWISFFKWETNRRWLSEILTATASSSYTVLPAGARCCYILLPSPIKRNQKEKEKDGAAGFTTSLSSLIYL